jgi:hypothetical protein
VRLKSLGSLALVICAVAGSVSCGEYVRNQGRAPVLAVINSLQGATGNAPDKFGNPLVSDVETLVTTPDPCTTSNPCITYFNDLGQVIMSLVLKDPGQPGVAAAPTSINAVTFTRYRVEYSRSDGRNTPGVDVPFPIDSAITFTVPADNTATASFELVRNDAKKEPPLRDLRTSGVILNTIATVTFYGHDLAGNDVATSGSIGVNFGNFVP